MKFFDKLKVMKDAGKMGIGGMQTKVEEIQKTDREFKEKELELLGKFEEKIDTVISNQKIILEILNKK